MHRAGSSPASRTIKLLVNSRAYGVICKPFSFAYPVCFCTVLHGFSTFFRLFQRGVWENFGKNYGRRRRHTSLLGTPKEGEGAAMFRPILILGRMMALVADVLGDDLQREGGERDSHLSVWV